MNIWSEPAAPYACVYYYVGLDVFGVSTGDEALNFCKPKPVCRLDQIFSAPKPAAVNSIVRSVEK